MNIKKQNSFTLIELIVVIAIIAVLAAVIAPNAYKAIEKAKAAAIGQTYKAISKAALSHYVDTGLWTHPGVWCVDNPGVGCIKWEDSFFVVDLGDLGWDGPYLDKAPPLNPWGKKYAYVNGLRYMFTNEPITPEAVFESDTRVLNSQIKDIDIQKRVDVMLDDGDLLTGTMRNSDRSNNSVMTGDNDAMLGLLVSNDIPIATANSEANP